MGTWGGGLAYIYISRPRDYRSLPSARPWYCLSRVCRMSQVQLGPKCREIGLGYRKSKSLPFRRNKAPASALQIERFLRRVTDNACEGFLNHPRCRETGLRGRGPGCQFLVLSTGTVSAPPFMQSQKSFVGKLVNPRLQIRNVRRVPCPAKQLLHHLANFKRGWFMA